MHIEKYDKSIDKLYLWGIIIFLIATVISFFVSIAGYHYGLPFGLCLLLPLLTLYTSGCFTWEWLKDVKQRKNRVFEE